MVVQQMVRLVLAAQAVVAVAAVKLQEQVVADVFCFITKEY
jgi:hypothetical protein